MCMCVTECTLRCVVRHNAQCLLALRVVASPGDACCVDAATA
jgi:hypothetical protein